MMEETSINSRVPCASIVIPYGGGGEGMLVEQLRAVDAAVLHARKELEVTCEVILSVNSPGVAGETRALVGSLSLHHEVHVIDSSARRGAAYARNRGVDAGTGERLLFCDADDVVATEWVAAMLRALERSEVVGGVLDLHALNPGAGLRRGEHAGCHTPKRDWGWLFSAPSSNLAITRSAFIAISGFDESLLLGEDKDLCWRAQYQGATFAAAPDAVVSYRWRSTLRSHFAQTFAWGVGDALLLSKHRPFGLEADYLGGLKRTARAIVYAASVPVLYPRRWHAIGALGKAVGRVFGSVRFRTWAL
jgi:GT2 family glycosyltransferase